ncbi:hypothetical protein FDV58_17835 [Bradyrhizobium elkanii]|uniref:Uncharacterized protein n=1 Tax=Bradyrhizobium elkanii TaxID=29448 RepID=A0A4U6RZA5_BRAEL|nr:hypothetical protein [Bradyrhizobium elkanii]TKV80110.1 hypothetical protein FDV58_17835 [Bradyrhizobium elkanii]
MKRPTSRAAPPWQSGTASFHDSYFEFDLELGVPVSQMDGFSPNGDFGWCELLRVENGAAYCALGLTSYETLDRHRLAQLTYDKEGWQRWAAGSVFAVRTRSGKYAKVELNDFYQFRWQTFDDPIFLDVKIVLGSAPSEFITRYVASCVYDTPYGRVTSCSGTFGPEGGVMLGQVSNDGAAFPTEVFISIAVDFAPATHLTGIVKNLSAPITETGVNFLFEPNQVLQATALTLDLRPTPLANDYLAVRWTYRAAGAVIASGQKLLSGADLANVVTEYDIMFQPNPIVADSLEVEIMGRLQNRDIARFDQTFSLPESVILLKSKLDDGASAYHLVSQFGS